VRISKNSKFRVIGGHYLTTEIIESTEDTEISMFPLLFKSARWKGGEKREAG